MQKSRLFSKTRGGFELLKNSRVQWIQTEREKLYDYLLKIYMQNLPRKAQRTP